MSISLPILKLNNEALAPTRSHPTDAGLDLYCLSDFQLLPQEPVRVATGIAVAIPAGNVGMICDRSSMGVKGVRVLGGVIDSGYRGEVQVVLINLRSEKQVFTKGSKIAQLLVMPIQLLNPVEESSLSSADRNEKGFGSSGA